MSLPDCPYLEFYAYPRCMATGCVELEHSSNCLGLLHKELCPEGWR